MPKLAQILKQSRGTRQVCVSVFFLFWSLYKANRFHAAEGLLSNRSQRTSKCGKNVSDTCTLACGSCATSSFLPHFDVICDLLLNRRKATWNLFDKYGHFLWVYHNTGGHFQWNLAGRCMWSFPRYLPNKLHLDGNHDYRHCIYQRLNKPGEKEKSKVNDPMTRRTMANSSSPYFWKAITAGLLYPVYRHPFWGRGDVCTQARLLTMAHIW